MSSLEFNDVGECETCRNIKALCRTGICEDCLTYIKTAGAKASTRKTYLKHLNKVENGVIQAACRQLRFGALQISRERKLTLSRVIKDGDMDKQSKIMLNRRIQALFDATPRELADSREKDALKRELVIVNDELMRWLAKHPEYMRELSPRKFEEVIAEILSDLGYNVQLTPCTRDGGRDIVAVVKTGLGEVLVIVECKRWLPPHKIGIAVVERFLHVLREKTKANLGIVAATTSFTLDAKKSAKEFAYLLKLADFDKLKEMAQNYGSWHRKKDSELWIPNYAAI